MSQSPNYWQRRQLTRRTFLYGTGVTAAGVIGAVACGSGDDDDGSAPAGEGSPAAGASPTAGASSTQAAKKGGTLNMIWFAADAQMDPHSTTEHLAPELYRAASHGLMKQKAITEEPTLDFATALEKPDPLTLIFKLDPRAKWHNVAPVNGRAVTSADVLFSLKRIGTPGPAAPRASTFSQIEGYEAPDAQTIKVKLKQPFVPILFPLSDKWTAIVAPEVVDKFGDLKRGDSIIGFGPFMAQNVESSKGATLVRNPDYWGTPAHLDKVVYTTIIDPDAQGAAYKSGQAHISSVLPDLLLDTFKSNDTNILKFDQVGVGMSLIGGPNDRAPLSDPRVRQAINLVVDRAAIGQAAFPGAELKNASFFGNPAWGIPEAEVAKMPGFGPKTTDAEIKQAKDLINAAGVSGVEITCNTTQAYNAHHIDRAQALVPMLDRIGIKLKLNVMEFAAMKDAENKKTLQFTAATYAAYGDANTPLINSFHSAGARNYWNYNDPTYDAMAIAQQKEEDKAKRLAMILDIQRYLMKSGTPVASDIWYQKSSLAVRKTVQNFQGVISAGSSCSGWFLPTMWLSG